MNTIFTKIINREIPAYIIAENMDCIAFLDAFPIQKGHVLVCPKEPIDQLFDLPDSVYKELWSFVKKISFAIKAAMRCKRIGVHVEGTEVPHAHIHLFPIIGKFDLSKKINISDEEKLEIQNTIKIAFDKELKL